MLLPQQMNPQPLVHNPGQPQVYKQEPTPFVQGPQVPAYQAAAANQQPQQAPIMIYAQQPQMQSYPRNRFNSRGRGFQAGRG